MFDAATASELASLVDRLADLPTAADDAERIDRIAALERLKAAAYAAQLSEVAEFAESQQAANQAMGINARQASRGIPEQVGLARKVSPAAAARQVSQARALMQDLPVTFELLRRGEISEHVATIVVTETSHLAAEDRRLVDKQLAEQLPGLSPKRAHAAARRLAIEADPAGAVARASNARKDRRVGIRPAPDTMAVLSALLPCEQGVAVYAALRRHADTQIAAGDGRTRGQIMADTLVELVTGQATAADISAEIGLVMTDSSLFGGDETAADLNEYGPIPADIARDIARQAGSTTTSSSDTGTSEASGPVTGDSGPVVGETPSPASASTDDEPDTAAGPSRAELDTGDRQGDRHVRRAQVFLRRLFTDTVTGIITNCDPRRRRFDGVLAKLLVYRDQQCRDPYCDAPIRHLDHIQAHATGGPTTATNGRGLCERGNYIPQMPGWRVRVIDPTRHIVETITPTGHRYRSKAPRAPGRRRLARPPRIETYFADLLRS